MIRFVVVMVVVAVGFVVLVGMFVVGIIVFVVAFVVEKYGRALPSPSSPP